MALRADQAAYRVGARSSHPAGQRRRLWLFVRLFSASQECRAGVLVEQIRAPDVAGQHVDRLVAANLLDLEHRGAVLCG